MTRLYGDQAAWWVIRLIQFMWKATHRIAAIHFWVRLATAALSRSHGDGLLVRLSARPEREAHRSRILYVLGPRLESMRTRLAEPSPFLPRLFSPS